VNLMSPIPPFGLSKMITGVIVDRACLR